MNQEQQLSRDESSTKWGRVFINQELMDSVLQANRERKDKSQRRFKQQCTLHEQLRYIYQNEGIENDNIIKIKRGELHHSDERL